MTKSEFADWRDHPITQMIFASLEGRIQEGRDELEASAGNDPVSDARKTGKIAGYRDLLGITYYDFVEQ